jgi:hypothetical protein
VAKRKALAVAAEIERQFAEAQAALSNPSVLAYQMAKEGGTGPWEDALADLIEDGHPQAELFKLVLQHREGMRGDGDGGDNPPLSVVFDRYRAERGLPAKSWLEWQNVRRRFEQTVGGADLPYARSPRAMFAASRRPCWRRSRGVGMACSVPHRYKNS